MATSKQRKDKLVRWADESIHDVFGEREISDSYNGQIAAFSVSVALSGLKPTFAIYNSSTSNSELDKTRIIELLAEMFTKDKGQRLDTDQLYKKVIKLKDDDASLQKDIIEYAIALKLAIRTFNLKKS